jgi:hypothetical protein
LIAPQNTERGKNYSMENIKPFTDILFYFIPAVIVMFAMFTVMRRFLESQQATLRKYIERDLHLQSAEEKLMRQRESMPLKLQAYERLVLFLERISPNALLVRVHRGGMAASQLQSELVITVRTEFEHNLSQQIYVSQQAWDEIKDAKEEIIRIINNAFSHVGANASGIQMSSQIFEQVLNMENLPNQKAIDFLKSEAKKILG